MKLKSLRMAVLLAVGSMLSLGAAHANDFTVYFTNGDPGNAIVGSGTFSFDGTYDDGTYMLTDLSNYDIDFNVYGESFTTSDIDTSNLADLEVVLYGGGTNFYFDTDCSDQSCYSSIAGGSLELDNSGGGILATEPNFAGNPPLDVYMIGDDSGPEAGGIYTTNANVLSSVPEPAPLLLLGTGLIGMFLLRRRFRQA